MYNFEELARNKIEESLKEGLREQWISRELRKIKEDCGQSGWLKNLAGLFAFSKILSFLRGADKPAMLPEGGC